MTIFCGESDYAATDYAVFSSRIFCILLRSNILLSILYSNKVKLRFSPEVGEKDSYPKITNVKLQE
jgi:hypothetical protein